MIGNPDDLAPARLVAPLVLAFHDSCEFSASVYKPTGVIRMASEHSMGKASEQSVGMGGQPVASTFKGE